MLPRSCRLHPSFGEKRDEFVLNQSFEFLVAVCERKYSYRPISKIMDLAHECLLESRYWSRILPWHINSHWLVVFRFVGREIV
ncbi:hypothetical protein WT27_04760 [Burkholderia territorii]|uniref:Uncharacterized protein n=1 Tax=Burkholderia territorii TaxID=1503055 RepID=A0A105VI65_9BURK|nr:hypothetical protein WT27_04760 [Burkholderia territorii]